MDMLDEVIGILTYYHGENGFEMNPMVSTEIEHYARAVLDIPDDEYVMMAARTSFTMFHRGLVIGRDAIYWRNDVSIKTTVNTLTWQQLSERKGQFKAHRRVLELGDGAVLDNIGSLNKVSVLINLLDLLIDKYNEQEGESSGFIFEGEKLATLVRAIPEDKQAIKAESEAAAADAATVSFLDLLKKLIGK